MKSHVALAVFCTFAASAVAAEENYALVKCNGGQSTFSAEFRSDVGAVRRFALRVAGVELSGNVKGFSPLEGVSEVRTTPRLEVHYKTGSLVGFGALSGECREKLKRAASSLRITLASSDG